MPPLTSRVHVAPLTTLKVGGVAEHYVEVFTEADVAAVCVYADTNKVPLTVLGGGSNVLVADAGLNGVVMRMQITGVKYIETDEVIYATVGAGETLDAVVADTIAKGYWGLENLSHIPGSVGATPIQNVGAYGVETSDVLESVRVYDRVEQIYKVLQSADCQFSYRDSIFKQLPGRYVVTSVTYRLSRVPQPQVAYDGLRAAGLTDQAGLAEIRDIVIKIRAGKFPDWHVLGTAGSFFKNPIILEAEARALKTTYPNLPVYPYTTGLVKVSLGYILDKVCNLRGYRDGPVELFSKQALVLVAYEGATAEMIEDFATMVEKTVYELTGIIIEREVTQLA